MMNRMTDCPHPAKLARFTRVYDDSMRNRYCPRRQPTHIAQGFFPELQSSEMTEALREIVGQMSLARELARETRAVSLELMRIRGDFPTSTPS